MLQISISRLMGCGVLAAAMCCAGTALAAGTTTVSGNVASWVKNAKFKGAAEPSSEITISVDLALTNVAGLKALVARVSNPKGAEYGRYLTAEEFAGRFAPAESDVHAVRALLEKAGMTHVKVGPMGTYVSATATVAQLKATFKVSQDLYTFAGKTLRANREEPTIPASLAGKVVYIGGLDDSAMLRKPFHRSISQGALVAPSTVDPSSTVTPPPVAANNPSPYCNKLFGRGALVATLSTAADVYGASIPWLGCGYTPEQIRAAYGLDKVRHYGKGITVAITDAYASPTILGDIEAYSASFKLPKPTDKSFRQIIPEGIYGVTPAQSAFCGGAYGWWEEESLDVAAVHTMAPEADIVYVGAEDCTTPLDIAFFNTMYNRVADVVTNSWGSGGEAIAPGSQQSYDQAMLAGEAQGITVLFSSGDDGDLSALNGVASGSWPATSAYATGVGGTTLLLKNAAGEKEEYGWGTYRGLFTDVTVHSAESVTTSGLATTSAFGYTFDDFSFYAGSGGGISLLEAQPAYQAKAVPATLATSLNLASGFVETLPNPQRVSPDISLVADPYTGFIFGETFTTAGNAAADQGCRAITKTTEFCETPIGGTSVASPLMAGIVAVMNSKRIEHGEPLVGFANPLLYHIGSENDVTDFDRAINQIIAPTEPVSLLRGYLTNPTELRLVTVNSAPFLIVTAPYALQVCGLPICLGLNEVFNYTSLSPAAVPPTPAGYNDVTGLGVPWVPHLINR